MGRLIRIKAKRICEYKNSCEYAALTRIIQPKTFHHRDGADLLSSEAKRRDEVLAPDTVPQYTFFNGKSGLSSLRSLHYASGPPA
jgi:hypothetical protein